MHDAAVHNKISWLHQANNHNQLQTEVSDHLHHHVVTRCSKQVGSKGESALVGLASCKHYAGN